MKELTSMFPQSPLVKVTSHHYINFAVKYNLKGRSKNSYWPTRYYNPNAEKFVGRPGLF